jgi:hypothetical protein
MTNRAAPRRRAETRSRSVRRSWVPRIADMSSAGDTAAASVDYDGCGWAKRVRANMSRAVRHESPHTQPRARSAGVSRTRGIPCSRRSSSSKARNATRTRTCCAAKYPAVSEATASRSLSGSSMPLDAGVFGLSHSRSEQRLVSQIGIEAQFSSISSRACGSGFDERKACRRVFSRRRRRLKLPPTPHARRPQRRGTRVRPGCRRRGIGGLRHFA